MDSMIRKALNVSSLKELPHQGGGGQIAATNVFMADDKKIFVKSVFDDEAYQMFTGEMESLKAISATSTVKVPEPILVTKIPKGAALVMEYFEVKGLSKKAGLLGDHIAKLHLHNIEQGKKEKANEQHIGSHKSQEYISKFGFHVPTCCGRIPQLNYWNAGWVDFFGQKLDNQISMIQKKCRNKEVEELWSELQLKLPNFFKDIEVKPSLLHGDLWCGNVGECGDEPVVYDPSCFYGHSEFDLAIAAMFGGFPTPFWDAYHKVIPKEIGWDRRHDLYILFHKLNHWNHFGASYKQGSINLMKLLSK